EALRCCGSGARRDRSYGRETWNKRLQRTSITRRLNIKSSTLIAATVASLLGTATVAAAHEAEHFSAGEPGNPKKPARTVTVIMSDTTGGMRYAPDSLAGKKGAHRAIFMQKKGEMKEE